MSFLVFCNLPNYFNIIQKILLQIPFDIRIFIAVTYVTLREFNYFLYQKLEQYTIFLFSVEFKSEHIKLQLPTINWVEFITYSQ